MGYVERRKTQRQLVSAPAFCEVQPSRHDKSSFVDEKQFEARLTNLSRGGAGIVADPYLPLETVLVVKVSMAKLRGEAETGDDIFLKGEVRACRKTMEGKHQINIFFSKLDKPSWIAVNDYLKR